MDFRIADTFTASLVKLNSDEQKLVKQITFDAQVNPANPGLKFHKLDKGRNKNFWSLRVDGGIRSIVHRMPGSILFCYTDHHDKAYAWAEKRKLETHPQTGADRRSYSASADLPGLGRIRILKALQTSLKAEIDKDAWESLNSAIFRPFDRPKSGRIAVKVINHLGDEVMKVYRIG